MRRCCWKNATNRLAPYRVATNLEKKKNVFLRSNKTSFACISSFLKSARCLKEWQRPQALVDFWEALYCYEQSSLLPPPLNLSPLPQPLANGMSCCRAALTINNTRWWGSSERPAQVHSYPLCGPDLEPSPFLAPSMAFPTTTKLGGQKQSSPSGLKG